MFFLKFTCFMQQAGNWYYCNVFILCTNNALRNGLFFFSNADCSFGRRIKDGLFFGRGHRKFFEFFCACFIVAYIEQAVFFYISSVIFGCMLFHKITELRTLNLNLNTHKTSKIALFRMLMIFSNDFNIFFPGKFKIAQ